MCDSGKAECVWEYFERVKSVNKEASRLSRILDEMKRVPAEELAALYERISTIQTEFATALIRTGGESLRKECTATVK